jgi:hypothetical protein
VSDIIFISLKKNLEIFSKNICIANQGVIFSVWIKGILRDTFGCSDPLGLIWSTENRNFIRDIFEIQTVQFPSFIKAGGIGTRGRVPSEDLESTCRGILLAKKAIDRVDRISHEKTVAVDCYVMQTLIGSSIWRFDEKGFFVQRNYIVYG